MTTYDVFRGDGRLVKVTVPPREEAAESFCEVCEEADGEPLTVPTPAWPYRTCRGCTDAWDEMYAEDPEACEMANDLAAIARFGKPAFELTARS